MADVKAEVIRVELGGLSGAGLGVEKIKHGAAAERGVKGLRDLPVSVRADANTVITGLGRELITGKTGAGLEACLSGLGDAPSGARREVLGRTVEVLKLARIGKSIVVAVPQFEGPAPW